MGAATTLVMLAVLAHARAGFAKPVPGAVAATPTLGSASVATLESVPRDPEFYQKKWRQIANEFYAAHPVDLPANSATVVTASLSDQGDDVNFALIPLGHSYGLGNLVVPMLTQGTAMVCGDSALPHAIAEAVARWKPTVFPTVPALLRALALADVPPVRLASLRTVISEIGRASCRERV